MQLHLARKKPSPSSVVTYKVLWHSNTTYLEKTNLIGVCCNPSQAIPSYCLGLVSLLLANASHISEHSSHLLMHPVPILKPDTGQIWERVTRCISFPRLSKKSSVACQSWMNRRGDSQIAVRSAEEETNCAWVVGCLIMEISSFMRYVEAEGHHTKPHRKEHERYIDTSAKSTECTCTPHWLGNVYLGLKCKPWDHACLYLPWLEIHLEHNTGLPGAFLCSASSP